MKAIMQCVGIDAQRKRATMKNTRGGVRIESMPVDGFELGQWYEIGFEAVAAPADAPDLLAQLTDGARPYAPAAGRR